MMVTRLMINRVRLTISKWLLPFPTPVIHSVDLIHETRVEVIRGVVEFK